MFRDQDFSEIKEHRIKEFTVTDTYNRFQIHILLY